MAGRVSRAATEPGSRAHSTATLIGAWPLFGERAAELRDDFCSGVGVAAGFQELCDVGDFVAGGKQRGFIGAAVAVGGEADGGEQSVANAFAALGVGNVTAFPDVTLDGFGRAAVAQCAVGFAEGMSQITQIA